MSEHFQVQCKISQDVTRFRSITWDLNLKSWMRNMIWRANLYVNMDRWVVNEVLTLLSLSAYSAIRQTSSNLITNFSLTHSDVCICLSVYRRMGCTSKVCSWRVPDGTEQTRCDFSWYQYLLVWFVIINNCLVLLSLFSFCLVSRDLFSDSTLTCLYYKLPGKLVNEALFSCHFNQLNLVLPAVVL